MIGSSQLPGRSPRLPCQDRSFRLRGACVRSQALTRRGTIISVVLALSMASCTEAGRAPVPNPPSGEALRKLPACEVGSEFPHEGQPVKVPGVGTEYILSWTGPDDSGDRRIETDNAGIVRVDGTSNLSSHQRLKLTRLP